MIARKASPGGGCPSRDSTARVPANAARREGWCRGATREALPSGRRWRACAAARVFGGKRARGAHADLRDENDTQQSTVRRVSASPV